MSEQKCSGDHSKHICELMSEGNLAEIKKVTREPNFICANCGRSATSDDNLCNPVNVDQIGFDAI